MKTADSGHEGGEALVGHAIRHATAIGTIRFSGSATGHAITNAVVFVDDQEERADWVALPKELNKLTITHLRMLSELTEPVIPKLRMLSEWQPKVMRDEIVRLAAASVLNEKLTTREQSHGRIIAWIGVIASIVAFVLGHYLGQS